MPPNEETLPSTKKHKIKVFNIWNGLEMIVDAGITLLQPSAQ